MTGYQNLEVWKKSMKLVTDVYLQVKALPKEETYSLADQIRRSAVSIPSNIAEGSSRNSSKEFIQFLYIALGSACELETQLLIAKNVGYIESFHTVELELVAVKKMLNALISSLKRSK
ncbi:four helix bundle protein [Hydrogenimonas sp.]|uniref:four helix bundle protein n=1 Tax=Hydrogenimonas sp. TaxID=2231112 RepID=UPI002603868E|nr:four helix bundle protein [Hydrogenimonas sp.]